MTDELGDTDAVVIAVEAAGVHTASAVGQVLQTGTRAAALYERRVLVGPIDPCGECEVCRRGGAAVCPQAVRRTEVGMLVTAAGRWVTPLGDGLELASPGAGAVAGDVALAYTLYARTGLGPRDPVVVVGASPVARFLVEILIAKSITPVVVADPAHVAWCEWLAPRATVAANLDGVAAAIASQGTGAKPRRIIAAAPGAAEVAAALAGPRSTLTVLAPVTGLPGALAANEVTVIGVAGAHPDLVVEAAAMCVKREIDLDAGTTTDPDAASAAMRSLIRTF
ncbi:MAG: alcohol dehydrogenase catalytic domain-containing protein [Kofleriaceae bacterium]